MKLGNEYENTSGKSSICLNAMLFFKYTVNDPDKNVQKRSDDTETDNNLFYFSISKQEISFAGVRKSIFLDATLIIFVTILMRTLTCTTIE